MQLHTQLACICSYLKSFLKYKFSILDTHHPGTLHICEQWCEHLWLFSEAKWGPHGHVMVQLVEAPSQKVMGSIPDGVIWIFHWHNPSGRTRAMGLTQPLIEMSTRNISLGGKGSQCVGLTTLPPSCADCLEIWEPQLHGNLGACPGL